MRTLQKSHLTFVGVPFMVTEKRLTGEHYAISGLKNVMFMCSIKTCFLS
jgi:hypothetical protein